MGKGSGNVCQRPSLSFATVSDSFQLWREQQVKMFSTFKQSKLLWKEDWDNLYLHALENAAYRTNPTWKLELYGMSSSQIAYVKNELKTIEDRSFNREDYWEDSYELVKEKELLWEKEKLVLNEEFFLQNKLVDKQQLNYIDEALKWLKKEVEEEQVFAQNIDLQLYQPQQSYFFNNSILDEGRINWLQNQEYHLDTVKLCHLQLDEQQKKEAVAYVKNKQFVENNWENDIYYKEWRLELIQSLIDEPILSVQTDKKHLAHIIAEEHWEEYPYDEKVKKAIYETCLHVLNMGKIESSVQYHTLGKKKNNMLLEAHMQVQEKDCSKLEKKLLKLGAEKVLDPTPYPYYRTENILQANYALKLKKDDMELFFIPNNQPIESSQRDLIIKKGDQQAQLQWLKELQIAENLQKDSLAHSYHEDFNDKDLNLPENACLVHYITGTDKSKEAFNRLQKVINGGGLLSSRERAKRNIMVKSLSPIGDAISGIDDGVSTSIKYKDNICHGGSINIIINPKMLARKKIQFSPTDWGAGDRKNKFENYRKIIQQKDKYPNYLSRQQHYKNLQEYDNECYIDKQIDVSEFEALIVDANIYYVTKKFVRQQQREGKLPAHIKVRPVPCEVDPDSQYDGYVNLEGIPKGLPLIFRGYSDAVNYVSKFV